MKSNFSPLEIVARHKLGVTFSAYARGGVSILPANALHFAADRHMAANSIHTPAQRIA